MPFSGESLRQPEQRAKKTGFYGGIVLPSGRIWLWESTIDGNWRKMEVVHFG